MRWIRIEFRLRRVLREQPSPFGAQMLDAVERIHRSETSYRWNYDSTAISPFAATTMDDMTEVEWER